MPDNPYFIARQHLKEANWNKAALMGKLATLGKLVNNIGNPKDPNSIYAIMQNAKSEGLLDDTCEDSISHAMELICGWFKDYSNAIDVLTREQSNRKKDMLSDDHTKLDLDDDPIGTDPATYADAQSVKETPISDDANGTDPASETPSKGKVLPFKRNFSKRINGLEID